MVALSLSLSSTLSRKWICRYPLLLSKHLVNVLSSKNRVRLSYTKLKWSLILFSYHSGRLPQHQHHHCGSLARLLNQDLGAVWAVWDCGLACVCVCVCRLFFMSHSRWGSGETLQVTWIGKCHIRVWSPLSVWDWCLAVTLPTRSSADIREHTLTTKHLDAK